VSTTSASPTTSIDVGHRPRRRPAAILVGPVAWEPCAAPLSADLGEEPCIRCGWLVDEHDAPGEASARRAPLRRAS
jgi:hypothetical protein